MDTIDMIDMIDIEKLSELACLSLSESEKTALARDLGDMLAFADAVTSCELSEDEPTVSAQESVLREDIPQPCMPRDELLAAARSRKDAYLAVPRVIGGGANE